MHPSLGPTSYPAQQQRNLSPITELTTPASLRSITFSLLADHDYRSEREGEDIPSPRSFESAQTILAAYLEPARSLSPVCSPTSPASQPPLIPLGSPVRTLRETDPSTTTQYLTTPPSTALIPDGPAFALRSSSLPTGVPILPSALRDSDTAPEAEDKRPVQRRTPSFIVDEAKSDRPELRMSTDWSEEEDAKSTAGLAGIGAGVASGPENAWMKRLSSVQEDQQAPNKERPKTFHGIGTEHVFDAVEGDFPLGMEPLDRIQMRVSLLQLVGRVLMPSQQGQAAAGSGQATSTLHFLLAACQSDPSLPLTRESTMSSTTVSPPTPSTLARKTPPRMRTFLSFLGTDPSNANLGEKVARRLSKHRRQRASPSFTGTISKTTPTTPSPPQKDEIDPLKTAIGSSGTFGIKDDGSELYTDGPEQHSRPIRSSTVRGRSVSGNGSVKSFRPRELLYVENMDAALSEDEGMDKIATETFHTPPSFDGPGAPVRRLGTPDDTTAGFDTRKRSFSVPSIRSTAGVLPERWSINSAAVLAQTFIPAAAYGVPTIGEPTLEVHTTATSPCSADHHTFYPSKDDVADTRQSMIDKGMQTSAASSPRRPLPRTPSLVNACRTSLIGSAHSRPNSDPLHPARRAAMLPGASTVSHSQISVIGATAEHLANRLGNHLQMSVPPPLSAAQPIPQGQTKNGRDDPQFNPDGQAVASSGRARDPFHSRFRIASPASHQEASDHDHSQISVIGSMGSHNQQPNIGPPHLHVPPPPPASSLTAPASHNTSKTSDLPLLIASHLLSTHSSTLMRHSSSMKDISETMNLMAKESLRWGEIILGMTNAPPHPGGPWDQDDQYGRQRAAPPSAKDAYDQEPLRGAFEKLSTGSMSLTGPATTRQDAQSDHLTPLPRRPSTARSDARSRRMSEASRKHSESLPADLLEEADRLGREGWTSLRRGEDAWMSAVTSLREMLDGDGKESVAPARSSDDAFPRTRLDSMVDPRTSSLLDSGLASSSPDTIGNRFSRSSAAYNGLGVGYSAEHLGLGEMHRNRHPDGVRRSHTSHGGGRKLHKGGARPASIRLEGVHDEREMGQAKKSWWRRASLLG